jgi:asparagine synthase (glutamine-hydrolysing)
MCGIAGIIHTSDRHAPPSAELLRAMIGTIRHRGPDEFGIYRDHHAGLVNARLSIIDVLGGQQPMSNEDGSFWIVFNGEIFNYIELRNELQMLGHRFRTQSDTEVVVHAYEAWGNDCFLKFNGQWAFALWDSQKRTLILSRDRIGVRPLYVRQAHGKIWFASEVKAIFSDPEVPRSIDPRGLDQTFTYWASLAPVSMFDGIEEIPPGSVRIYDSGGSHREWLFWRPLYADPREPYALSIADATEVLREKLMRATELRTLRADVPVGSYLSGGLDSSLVAWMGRKAKEGSFQTFSIRFDDAEFDETAFQQLMASQLDSTHNDIVVSRRDIARVFPEVVWHTERPILRTAPAPLYLLSQRVRRSGIKAVLTGEGADEMLAGYDLFREAKIRQFWSRQPESTIRPRLFERIYPYLARSPNQTKGMALQFWKQGLERAHLPGFSHEPRWSTTSSLKRFFSSDIRQSIRANPAPDVLSSLPTDFGKWDPLAQAQYLEVVTLLSGYLISSQGDRMLMAHSVEGRFPFLDSDVMDFCNGLPADYKLRILDEKHILKKVARGVIPDQIVRRQKQPYRAPDAISFVGTDAPEYVREMLSEKALKESGLFDGAAVRGFYQKCLAKGKNAMTSATFSNSDNMALVGILSTQLLYHLFVGDHRHSSGDQISFTTKIDRVSQQAQQTTQENRP